MVTFTVLTEKGRTMSDYIERKSIRNLYSCLNPEDKVRVEQVLTDIDAIPTLDAVEVVRCKECKYAEVYDGYYTQICCENGVIGGHGELWNPDDFCSYGERKDVPGTLLTAILRGCGHA